MPSAMSLIGNLQTMSVPVKMATERGESFKPGDEIVVTLNDHNAIVDYHHPNQASHHQVIRGKLSTPLTVGLDKAVIETDQGTKTFMVAERAKGKLTAIPIGAEVLFLAEGTVKNHVSTLLVKLGARDRTNAVLRALHEGILG